MGKNVLHIEKLPFFETFQGNGKAIIDITAFEKWIIEFRNAEGLLTETERTSSRTSAAGDDPFFSDDETYQGDVPDDVSENHDRYLYGEEL